MAKAMSSSMGKIDAYIRNSVLSAIIAVILVLVLLDAIFALIDQLDDIKGDYQLAEVMRYVVLSIPTRLYEFVPMAALIGTLAGLGALASSSELVAMRAAGVSVQRITWSALKPVSVVMVLSLMMGEYIVPNLERMASTGRAIALGKAGPSYGGGVGHWHREGNQFMHFRAIETKGVLHNVTLYYFNDSSHLEKVVYSRRGQFVENKWTLNKVQTTHITPTQVSVEKQNSASWETQLTPEKLKFVSTQPSFMAISTLWDYANYMGSQGLNAGEFELAFWKKITQPLTAVALVILGISSIFGPLRSVSMGQRIFTGVLIGMVYKFSVDLLGPAALVFGVSPLMANLVPLVICLYFGFRGLSRAG